MATNQVYNYGDQFDVPAAAVAAPATPGSGDALLIGDALPAVALTDPYDDASGTSQITVKTNGVYELEVAAAGGAIAVGDLVYIDSTTGALNDSNGNVRFGYALGAIDNGATATIPVKIGY